MTNYNPDMHRYTIHIVSSEDGYTVFTVTSPLTNADGAIHLARQVVNAWNARPEGDICGWIIPELEGKA